MPSTEVTSPSTTTVEPEEDAVILFVTGVNEESFVSTSNGTVQSDYVKLEDHILALAADYSSGNNTAVCQVLFSPPYSCRQECQMTDDPDRGCVKMIADVQKSVYCGYSNNILRLAISTP